jgi:hypothetical protein
MDIGQSTAKSRQPLHKTTRNLTTTNDSDTGQLTGRNRQPTLDNQQQTTAIDRYTRQIKQTPDNNFVNFDGHSRKSSRSYRFGKITLLFLFSISLATKLKPTTTE